MHPRIETNSDHADRCIGIAFTQLRFIRSNTKQYLYQNNFYSDLIQEIATLGWEAHITHPSANLDTKEGFREVKNHIQRGIYKFLKNYGFCRQYNKSGKEGRKQGKGFCRREITINFNIFDDQDIEVKIK